MLFIIPDKYGNCSDTAPRVAETFISANVITFVSRHVCFGARTRSQDFWPFLILISHLGDRAMNPRRNSSGNRASPVNQAHVKFACEKALMKRAARK